MANINPTAVEDDPARPNKAYVSAIGSALLTFGATWVADEDPFTLKEAVQAGISAVLLGGALGGITFSVKNPKRVKR